MARGRGFLRYSLLALAILTALWYYTAVGGQRSTWALVFQKESSEDSLPKTSSQGSATDTGNSLQNVPGQDVQVIPNIVHYVWVLEKADGVLEFQFKHFVSIYSSFLYLQPDSIYIHTNAYDSVILAAKNDPVNLWTRKIFDIPGVKVRLIDVPTHTRHGVKLEHLEHRSDFVRPGILREFGGVYLDFDVVPIRDMKPLRESGFRHVFGHELHEKVNNGVMLAVKGSHFMDIFDRDQHEAFNGWWIEHSVHQLTRMANAFIAIPNEVLIMERHAFIPDGWDEERHARLFQSHETQALAIGHSHITSDEVRPEAFSFWEWNTKSRQRRDWVTDWDWSQSKRRRDWELDYSRSYTIHALSPPLHYANRTAACLEISWDYVMERTSNYAAQIYPAMAHANKTMFISTSMHTQVPR